MITDNEKAKRCLERALQRAGFSVLKKYGKIPQEEYSLVIRELHQIFVLVCTHAMRLGWVEELPQVLD